MNEHSEHEEYPMPAEEEEEMLKRKYGGVMPKKPSLINQDNERAYFDSADWELEKQGEKADKLPEGSEALPPKLQPTQQQSRSRRLPCAPENYNNGNIGSEELSIE